MREIKFRIWHNSSFHYFTISTLLEINDQVFSSEPIQQYTGLKDKNGIEIYEGDIIRADSGYYDGEEEWQSMIEDYTVQYEPDLLRFTPEFCFFEDVEIIGNIYDITGLSK